MTVAFTTAPILAHFNTDKKFFIETDSSGLTSTSVLSQYNSEVILPSVAFYLQKHSLAVANYKIYSKKLIAFDRNFEEWRPELSSTEHPVSILFDYMNLE